MLLAAYAYAQPQYLKQGILSTGFTTYEVAWHPQIGPTVWADDSTGAHCGGAGGGSSLRLCFFPWLHPETPEWIPFPAEPLGYIQYAENPQDDVWIPCTN
jgi:hypothetical protein